MTRARPARRAAQVGGGAVAVLLLLLATAGTASAHARLVSTDPAVSSVLLVSPTQVVLHFDDVVTVDGGSLRVFGPDGGRVDDGGEHTTPAATATPWGSGCPRASARAPTSWRGG